MINMTAEMNRAFLMNTVEGMTLGVAYAAAVLEEPTPSCSDEDLEDIRAAKAALEATESSINAFVTAAEEAVANATSELAAAKAAAEEALLLFQTIVQELEEKETALQLMQSQLDEILSEIESATFDDAATSTTATPTYSTGNQIHKQQF